MHEHRCFSSEETLYRFGRPIFYGWVWVRSDQRSVAKYVSSFATKTNPDSSCSCSQTRHTTRSRATPSRLATQSHFHPTTHGRGFKRPFHMFNHGLKGVQLLPESTQLRVSRNECRIYFRPRCGAGSVGKS